MSAQFWLRKCCTDDVKGPVFISRTLYDDIGIPFDPTLGFGDDRAHIDHI